MRNWNEFFIHLKGTGFTPTTIVDVGVATDTEDLYFHYPTVKYLFVEPLAEFEPSLQVLCSKFNGVYMLAAAGPTDGTLEINVSPDLGGSSKFRTIESNDGAYSMVPRTVPQYKIDTMWEALGLTGPALLKIDVQGGELEVLKGAEKVLNNFEVILMEVGVTEGYVGQPIFHEYLNYMAERGFVMYDIIHTGYSDAGLLYQLDIVFVKKDGQFRKDQRAMSDYTLVNEKVRDYKGITRNDNL
jgi:FkbM family methyltransferase